MADGIGGKRKNERISNEIIIIMESIANEM